MSTPDQTSDARCAEHGEVMPHTDCAQSKYRELLTTPQRMLNITDAGGPHHPDCPFPHEQCVCAEIAREFGAEKVDCETYGMEWCVECQEFHD